MKILVAIANYGSKNIDHVRRLIAEYRSMPFEIDIFLLCEAEKRVEPGVSELVGLPTKDPWSLPFAHRPLFVENAQKYDLFIYTEDDTLITEANIRAFVSASKALPPDKIAGFVRYEVHPDGRRNYPDIHGAAHWMPGSVERHGDLVVARLSNEHSACYILTSAQLERAVASGGYALLPHSGRYDLLCTAATDPYTQCGMTRVICVSHLSEFELHHLPNAYLNRMGVNEHSYDTQVSAILDMAAGKRSKQQLFDTEKPKPGWDWDYYKGHDRALDWLLDSEAQRVLSVGCASGETETRLVQAGKQLTVIPIDSIIGSLSEQAGMRVLEPNLSEAFKQIDGEHFDVILLADVLHHLRDPVATLRTLRSLVGRQGRVVGTIPNLGLARRLVGRVFGKNVRWSSSHGSFDTMAFHLAGASTLKQWLRHSGFDEMSIRHQSTSGSGVAQSFSRGLLPDGIAAEGIVFSARHKAVH